VGLVFYIFLEGTLEFTGELIDLLSQLVGVALHLRVQSVEPLDNILEVFIRRGHVETPLHDEGLPQLLLVDLTSFSEAQHLGLFLHLFLADLVQELPLLLLRDVERSTNVVHVHMVISPELVLAQQRIARLVPFYRFYLTPWSTFLHLGTLSLMRTRRWLV